MKEYPIVFSTDNNYIPYLSAAIRSLIENANKKDEYKIFVLYEKLDIENITLLKTMAGENISIDFIDVRQCLKEYRSFLYEKMHFSFAMYYRFLIPEIFKDYEKVLYLDCDLIVNCDVREIFEIDLKDNIIAASIETVTLDIKNSINKRIKSFNLKPENYFNSGVLLFDINKSREFNLFEKCIENISKYKNLFYPDQTVLNFVCKDNFHHLDLKYNFQWQTAFDYDNFIKNIDEKYANAINNAIKNPKIIHYTSRTKPWNSIKRKQYLAHYFWKYARLTPFYEIILFKMFASVEEEYKKITKLKLLNCKIKSKIPWKKQDYYRKKYMNLKEKIRIYEELKDV